MQPALACKTTATTNSTRFHTSKNHVNNVQSCLWFYEKVNNFDLYEYLKKWQILSIIKYIYYATSCKCKVHKNNEKNLLKLREKLRNTSFFRDEWSFEGYSRQTIANTRGSLKTLKLAILCPYLSYSVAINENFRRCEKLVSVPRKFN